MSKKTLEYAEKRRAKLNTQGVDVVEHLLMKHSAMAEKKRDFAQKINDTRDNDEEATFKPKTLNYQMT